MTQKKAAQRMLPTQVRDVKVGEQCVVSYNDANYARMRMRELFKGGRFTYIGSSNLGRTMFVYLKRIR